MAYEGEKKPKKRKRVTGLQVHEISLVDKPAVPDARFVIAKRKPEGGEEMPEKEEGKITEEETVEKQEPKENPVDKVRTMVSDMMEMRRSLPGPVRRTIMELDMLLDEMTRGAEKAEDKDEEEMEEKRGEEEKEEKAEDKDEEKEEKAGDKDKEKKKAEHQDCPPGMKFDIASQKCVPMEEKKKPVKKAETEKDDEENQELSFDGVEFSDEQNARLDKLLSGVKE